MSKKNTITLLILLVSVLFLTACAKLSSRVLPNTDLSRYESYFVVRHAKDTRHIDEIIRDEMNALGMKTSSGPIGEKPLNVDAIVTYEDRWAWDITTYMLSLSIDFRDAKNDVLLATGQSYRPSLERTSPEKMAREVLQSIMNKIPAAARPPESAVVEPPRQRSDIVERDGRFEKLANGVVYDTRTGLEWFAGPDHDTNYADAMRWIESLAVDGGGWRMPLNEELKGLYQKGAGQRNMTPLLKTSGWYLWYVEARVSGAAWDFRYNSPYRGYSRNVYTYHTRVFAVRSTKTQPRN